MDKKTESIIQKGMKCYARRISGKKKLYLKLLALADKDTGCDKVYRINDTEIFCEAIQQFGPALDSKKAKHDLMSLYDIGIHKETGALIISNKGATLFSLSPKTDTPYLTRHIGLCVYLPGLGVEMVNVGLVGDVYSGKVIFRAESACTPSFLFGSQRCNCAHQWDNLRELAAYFNKIALPDLRTGTEFENWVQGQAVYKDGLHLFKQNGSLGFVLMHLDTQNGMGSGYTDGEFSFDLYTKASMRHRGEYSAEQIHKTSMYGGFEAIGIRADPRQEHDFAGYKVPFVVMDYLGVSRDIVFLTNNPHKMLHLKNNGYNLTRVKHLGAVNLAGAQEAEQRMTEFAHLDIGKECISFKEEFDRLCSELSQIAKLNS